MTAQATTYLQRNPQQLVLAADLVFLGTVSEESTELEAGLPWTVVTFQVEELLRDRDLESTPGDDGNAPKPPERIALRFLGGSASSQRLTVSGLPSYQRGERYLIFAYQRAGIASPLAGVRQGSWQVATDGLRDADGAYLAVLDQGGLQRVDSAAESSGLEAVLASLRAVIEAGVASEEPLVTADNGESGSLATDEPLAAAENTEPASDGPEDKEQALEATEPEPDGSEPEGAEPEPAATELEPEGSPTPEPAAPLQVVYRVDDSGGPGSLSSAVSSAAAVWQGAAAGVITFSSPGPEVSGDADIADNLIRYGAPTLLGPDALSLTLARDGGASTEVLVSPDAGTVLPQVLLHELGILAGLPEDGEGVMSFQVDADVTEPHPADIAALLARRDFPPEDLNRDGVVDFYDLAAFGRAYGSTGLNLAADFNGDGRVDDADLAILEAAYTFTQPSEQAPSGD